MINHHTHPDPAIADCVRQCQSLLGQLAQRTLATATPAPESQTSPGAIHPTDTEVTQAALLRLCEDADWPHALVLATRLFMADVRNARRAYLLATCLQRLGQHHLALAVFTHCAQLEADAPTPGPMFRVGECLAALQRPQEALTAFDTAIDLARADTRHAPLLACATAKAEALRAHA